MFRTLLQFLIAQKVDDDQRMGYVLSWFIRHDGPTRRFYENLSRLDERLRSEATNLLSQSGVRQDVLPFRSVRVWIGSTGGRRECRREKLRSICLASLVLLLTVASFLATFSILQSGAKVYASPQLEAERLEATTSDPQIREQLDQLCRSVPNDAGPFFQSSVLPIEP